MHPPEAFPLTDARYEREANLENSSVVRWSLCFPQLYARGCVPERFQPLVDSADCSAASNRTVPFVQLSWDELAAGESQEEMGAGSGSAAEGAEASAWDRIARGLRLVRRLLSPEAERSSGLVG